MVSRNILVLLSFSAVHLLELVVVTPLTLQTSSAHETDILSFPAAVVALLIVTPRMIARAFARTIVRRLSSNSNTTT